MNRYDWKSRLDDVYASFPEASQKPVIGITGNYGEQTCKLAEGYYKSVLRAGGVPLIIPPLADTDAIINTLGKIDALLLSGGGDYNPLLMGQEPLPALGGINSERDIPELLITRLAYNRQIPILGICRGLQTLAIALDGEVAQDIRQDIGADSVKHSQDAPRDEATHSVVVDEDSVLYDIYKATTLYVNSFHHQAVSDAGTRLRVVARAVDGVTEAVESREFRSIVGVQWHPECMEDGLPLFEWLVAEAANYRRAVGVHHGTLTLDTHCDTPMFFNLKAPEGKRASFGKRDSRLLVDLHKMTEGHQDATIMVAYLPQPKMGETFSSLVDCEVAGPTEYADLIFDTIEDMVERHRQYVSIARTPADLYADKRSGRKSIMLGIENGLALNGQLQQLAHFAQRSVR